MVRTGCHVSCLMMSAKRTPRKRPLPPKSEEIARQCDPLPRFFNFFNLLKQRLEKEDTQLVDLHALNGGQEIIGKIVSPPLKNRPARKTMPGGVDRSHTNPFQIKTSRFDWHHKFTKLCRIVQATAVLLYVCCTPGNNYFSVMSGNVIR